ncbi:hypothetical protein BC827DRAFT_91554 [Russula dissimulans]|nr:hypothetical protein BC827DRAFT_91554 [Russula dissimulans]
MFPLPMLKTIPEDLENMDSRYTLPYHLAFMKNTILRALNNIHAHASELQHDDPRLVPFLEYIVGFCDVVVLHIHTDECLFRNPVVTGVALGKVLGEGCTQNMEKVLKGVTRLKNLAKKYVKHPGDYNGQKIIARLYDFSEEFSARSWAQIHSIDVTHLMSVCSETEMRHRLQQLVASFLGQSNVAFLIPFIYSHHDRETSEHWPTMNREVRLTIPCLAKEHSR